MPKKKTTTTTTSKPELVFRSFGFTADERRINEETRTIIMPVSSELPVSRWDGDEVLIHTEDSVDLSRMNNGAAVMHSHDWNEQVGVIERAWIEGNRLWAEMRFSRSAQGETVWMDIVDGIRRNVSIGYQVKKKELVKSEDEKEDVYHVTKWMPYEASIVAVPADPSVGVGRSLADTEDGEPETGDNEAESTPKVTKNEPEKKREGIQVMEQDQITQIRQQLEKEFAEKSAAEKNRCAELRAIGNQCQMAEDAERAIAEEMPVDKFRAQALEKVATRAMQASKPIGMNEQEIREFSFRKAIYGQLRDSGIDNKFERECSAAYAKQLGKDARGLFVPPDVLLARTFNKTTGAGSNLIATELRPDMFIDILRNMSVTAQAGAMMMPGLVGNVAMSRQTGAMTSYWFDSESAGITAASNPTVDQVTLSPKTLGAYGDISRSLLKQSTPGAEQLVRNDIAAVIALAIDLAALKGTASNGQPRGITQTSGINAANWTAANTPTWAELVAMETAVDLANALAGEFVYVMGANLVGKCKTTLKDSGVSGYLMESDRTINGYRVVNSNQLGAGEAIFGKFSSLIIGMWGGLDLQVNPYIEALEKAGAIRVTALQDVDVAVRQPKEFTYNSNTPAS